jgi:hypothetical protein
MEKLFEEIIKKIDLQESFSLAVHELARMLNVDDDES